MSWGYQREKKERISYTGSQVKLSSKCEGDTPIRVATIKNNNKKNNNNNKTKNLTNIGEYGRN